MALAGHRPGRAGPLTHRPSPDGPRLPVPIDMLQPRIDSFLLRNAPHHFANIVFSLPVGVSSIIFSLFHKKGQMKQGSSKLEVGRSEPHGKSALNSTLDTCWALCFKYSRFEQFHVSLFFLILLKMYHISLVFGQSNQAQADQYLRWLFEMCTLMMISLFSITKSVSISCLVD